MLAVPVSTAKVIWVIIFREVSVAETALLLLGSNEAIQSLSVLKVCVHQKVLAV